MGKTTLESRPREAWSPHPKMKRRAIARLIKCQPRDEAEYAVIVIDSWQQKTLGRALSGVCM